MDETVGLRGAVLGELPGIRIQILGLLKDLIAAWFLRMVVPFNFTEIPSGIAGRLCTPSPESA